MFVRCVKDSLAELSGSALFAEVYRAYLDARRHKRGSKSQLEFESNLEPNLLSLARDIERREYELSPSACFIYEGKVKREVVAAAFRDPSCIISSGTGPTCSLNGASSTIATVAAKGKGRFSAFGGLPDSCARQVTTFSGIAGCFGSTFPAFS